jgi:ubiquitin-protein ligase
MILFRNKKVGKVSISSSMTELRVLKDLTELAEHRAPSSHCFIHISMPQRDRIGLGVPVVFSVKAEAAHVYAGAVFMTLVQFPDNYPFVPPSILVLNRVYHPNVDIDTGELHMDLLTSENWKPVFTLSSIIFAIELTLLEPNFNFTPKNAVNEEMVIIQKMDGDEFKRIVRRALLGGRFGAYDFAPMFGRFHTLKRKLPCDGDLGYRRSKLSDRGECMDVS